MWVGHGHHRVMFSSETDLDLIAADPEADTTLQGKEAALTDEALRRFPDRRGRYRGRLRSRLILDRHDQRQGVRVSRREQRGGGLVRYHAVRWVDANGKPDYCRE